VKQRCGNNKNKAIFIEDTIITQYLPNSERAKCTTDSDTIDDHVIDREDGFAFNWKHDTATKRT
jgi:hypothetical protein